MLGVFFVFCFCGHQATISLQIWRTYIHRYLISDTFSCFGVLIYTGTWYQAPFLVLAYFYTQVLDIRHHFSFWRTFIHRYLTETRHHFFFFLRTRVDKCLIPRIVSCFQGVFYKLVYTGTLILGTSACFCVRRYTGTRYQESFLVFRAYLHTVLHRYLIDTRN